MASKFSQGTGFLYNLLTLLSGFTLPVGHYIYNRATGKAPSLKEQVSSDLKDYKDSSAGGFLSNLLDSDPLSNWMKQNFGTGLTQRDKDVMAWNKEQTDIAWNRELEASNTAMQRKVADYQAAGVNPMLAGEGGVSLPSAVAANVSPSAGNFQLDSILRIIEMANMLPLQKKATEAQIDSIEAGTEKTRSETKGIDILNNYRAESEELRLEGNRLSNDLSREDRDKIREQKNLLIKQQDLISKQADTEVERKNALVAKRILDNASATQIAALLPYHQVLMSAQAGRERAAAELSLANAAMQIGLIDAGYIDQQLRNLKADATEKEIENVGKAFDVGMRTGQMPEGYEYLLNDADAWSVKNILAPVRNVGESFGPLVGLLFKPTVRSRSTISK